jgi:chromate reductase
MSKPTIAVLVGSARKGSINQALAEALGKLAEGKLAFDFVPLTDLPMFNGDIENDPPAEVWAYKKRVEAAHGLLFVTPEYNRSIPALMKNAIDWASRPWGKNSFKGKPGAVIGATPGMTGAIAAQLHLKQCVAGLEVIMMTQPEAYTQLHPGAIDEDHNFTEERQRTFLTAYIDALAAWVARVHVPAHLPDTEPKGQ